MVELLQLSKLNVNDTTVGVLREMEDEALIFTEQNGKIRMK
ncbi:MAG: hypothetical protein WDZ72_01730 [Cyclobacteriaceae bacterium]